MAEAQPTPPADDFLNVFLTAFLGIGVVVTVQSAEDAAKAEDANAPAL
jgi:hypothetical protein